MISRSVRLAFCVLWLAVAAVGLAVLSNYQNAAGAVGETPSHWPARTALSLATEHDTLVMFAHPRCPCTRASMEELNQLLARCQGRVNTYVLFLTPTNASADWKQTDLWRSASALPHVTVREDRDGIEAGRFGAETSGFVVLYSPRGELLFKGGITAARGHIGDNVGVNLISALSTGENVAVNQTPVYGCSLVSGCNPSSEFTHAIDSRTH